MSTSSFYFRPGKGEQIETTVHLEPDAVSAIHGQVLSPEGGPAPGAMLLLFDADGEGKPKLVSHLSADEEGRFLFGPLEPGKLYLMKAGRSELKVRELETTGAL